MRTRSRYVIAALLVLGLISMGTAFWKRHPRGGTKTRGGQTARASSSSTAVGAPAVGTPDMATGSAAAAPAVTRKRLDEGARTRLEAALATARTRRTSAAPGAAAAPALPAAAPTKLDLANKTGHELSDWERRQLDALNDLLGECYDLARAGNPALAGKVSLQFTVAAEPEIGGLVSEIRFDEGGTTIADAGLRECMTESLHALELEPPPEGVEVSRQVTLDLSPEP